jgi:ABC-type polysaccharide/polyol phosphate export permease
MPGTTVGATAGTFDHFNSIIAGVISPMFLTSGAFFPISALPAFLEVLARCNPLHHTVELLRSLVLGSPHWSDWTHVGVLLLFASHIATRVQQLRSNTRAVSRMRVSP